MSNIDLYKYLQLAKNKAKKEKIKGDIELSHLKTKKYKITLPNNKQIHFGHPEYEDFLIHKDPKRKEKFHSRWKNHKGYNDKSSPLYYSQKILW